jgi:hypothetical protein
MEEITLEVPQEPPPLSVVLDGRDLAWQRLGGRWVRLGTPTLNFGPGTVKGPQATWVELLAAGPVRVIHWAPAIGDAKVAKS